MSDSKFNKDVIQKIANLARLQLTQEQANEFSEQLSKIILHFDEISSINTEGVEHPLRLNTHCAKTALNKIFTLKRWSPTLLINRVTFLKFHRWSNHGFINSLNGRYS